MSRRIKVADLELAEPIPHFTGLKEYAFVQLLLRWQGSPLGYVKIPVCGDSCAPEAIREKILEEHVGSICKEVVRVALKQGITPENWNFHDLLKLSALRTSAQLPTVSVAVCTRDRAEDLALCLSALKKLLYQPVEILVVDNAPKTSATREMIEKFFPDVRYILEPRPGLDWARNRAVAEARGQIIAYTDDDVIVDAEWTRNLAMIFGENPEVMAVTGLVVPYELETEAQLWFEQYGGFGRGFDRKWYRATQNEREHLAEEYIGAGKFGTGANMAYRRSVFSEIGLFDPALDVGTVTQGGGDLDMFFRVLKYGHTLVYEPAAMVRHRHRRDYGKLYTQIASNGIGFYSHLVRNAVEFPEERRGILKFGLRWLYQWNVRRWLQALFKPLPIPRELVSAEFKGCFVGLARYSKACAQARTVRDKYGPSLAVLDPPTVSSPTVKALKFGIAVRSCEITESLRAIEDVAEYLSTRITLTLGGKAVGQLTIHNRYRTISVERLADEIVQRVGLELLNPWQASDPGVFWSEVVSKLKQHLSCSGDSPGVLPSTPVSIVVATRDRPEALHECLISLTAQITTRPVEIVVVDNNPQSGATREVVASFPSVRLIAETRPGLSYARNTGFAASTGEILICADDDIIAPPDWLENLLVPFARNDVMLVTGNVFPVELETPAQIQFECYGGLGRGFRRKEFNRDWFDSFRKKAVPTWEIGATANAALRACILHDPAIGMLDEALGAGTPTGCSEDTYLFYRVLKAGYTIVYEPSAYVWHKHRNTEDALEKQIYCYSKGHAAYHLTTFLRDRDGRGLVRVLLEIPRHQLRQLVGWVRGERERSLNTICLEIVGNILGALALWKSRRRLRELGPSLPYTPLELRRIVGDSVGDKQPLELPTVDTVVAPLEVMRK